MRRPGERSACFAKPLSATRPTRVCQRLSAAGLAAASPAASMSVWTGGQSGWRAARWMSGSARTRLSDLLCVRPWRLLVEV
jgi:hypothetical protein